MLTGEKPTENRWQALARVLLIRAVFSPMTLMGVGLTWVGTLSLGPRKDIPELWICLPAGLILLLVIQGIVWWATISLPRKTIVRFALDGEDLAFETKAHGAFNCLVGDIERVMPARNRKGKVTGWWICPKGRPAVFLDAKTSHCRLLLDQLNPVREAL